jgi:hypothetical protein
MAGYQTDTVQCSLLLHIQPIVLYRAVTKKLCATSFFIFCTTCLWDVVGHFLGRYARPRPVGATGLCGRLSVVSAALKLNHFK